MSFRLGLAVFLALVIFDGAVRKWLLPGWEQAIYLAKDVVLFAMLLWYLVRRGPNMSAGTSRTALAGWLGAYAAIAVLQTLNPALPSFVLGLLGLKSHLLYSALIVLVPTAVRDTDDLMRVLRFILVPVILVLVLGIAQFYFPVDHPLNRYVRGSWREVATFGLVGKVRVTSTFSYISGMTVFVFFTLCASLAILAAGRWRIRGNVIATACLVAAVVVTPMTGARWIFYMATICLPAFLFGMIRVGLLQARSAWRVVTLSFLGIAAVSLWSIEALESLEYRRQSVQDAPTRIESLLLGPLKFGVEAGLLGFGVGATHQAAPTLVPDGGYYTWLPILDFEDEPGRIMLELGLVGFIAAFGLRLYLCRLAWRAMMAGATRAECALAGAAFVFLVAHVISPIVFNVTGGALYWLFAGIVATILRDQHRRRAAQPEMPPGATVIEAGRVIL